MWLLQNFCQDLIFLTRFHIQFCSSVSLNAEFLGHLKEVIVWKIKFALLAKLVIPKLTTLTCLTLSFLTPEIPLDFQMVSFSPFFRVWKLIWEASGPIQCPKTKRSRLSCFSCFGLFLLFNVFSPLETSEECASIACHVHIEIPLFLNYLCIGFLDILVTQLPIS